LFCLTCAAAVALWIGNWVARPHLFCEKQKEQIAELREQVDRIASGNAELRGEIERLRTTPGAVEEARSQGWVEPGERPILFTDDPPQSE